MPAGVTVAGAAAAGATAAGEEACDGPAVEEGDATADCRRIDPDARNI